ncbi:MAG: chemotaxis protein CheV [Oscillospiraceae bacterium]|nr:chemotaxis protein CheV [Oscillospiraceae bacterium]
MQADILTRSDSTEVELLEFTVGGNSYGINISKVSEIMQDCAITPIPNSPEAVEGVIIPRDQLITVIDLHRVLGYERKDVKSIFIVCRFNAVNVAFRVGGVKGFRRISWREINEPPSLIAGENAVISTGVAKVEDRIIVILDFEKILADIAGETPADDMSTIDKGRIRHKDAHLVLVDDSPFLRRKAEKALRELGFTNITMFANGEEAWDYLCGTGEKVDCLVSDIEMPIMDGIALTKKIRAEDKLRDIPVILFSSLIDEKMTERCIEAGAQAQYAKPDLDILVDQIIKITNKE